MKILPPEKVKKVDNFTIENEPVLDINLMERAAKACFNFLVKKIKLTQKIYIICGSGNNGGDGLAIARMLAAKDYHVSVWLTSEKRSKSSEINLNRLREQAKTEIIQLNESGFPEIKKNSVIIDAIFGSGLSRKAEGFLLYVIKFINQQKNTKVIAIDIPSGFFAEDNSKLTFNKKENFYPEAVKADLTLTLELPFLSFMFPDSDKNVGNWEILPIGLHKEFLRKIECDNHYIDRKRIAKGLKKRTKFSHKGTYGHALLVAGSYGRMGAAVLASKACMRSGVGLLTTHVPRYGYQILQNTIPEAMISIDMSDIIVTDIPALDKFTAIGVGPSLKRKTNSRKALCKLFEEAKVPLVIDADALNIISENPEMLAKIPENSILTPHPKEFERLAGSFSSFYERYQKAKDFAEKHKLIVVLKGAHTCTFTPNGKAYFNSSGNAGMGTAGSGDVLTGLILSFLAQGFKPKDAAVVGVYIHGLAGDIALSRESEESLIASDIVKNIGKAFKLLFSGGSRQ